MVLFGILEIKLLTKKEKIKNLLRQNKKLEAIKLCKDLYKFNLSQANNMVNKLQEELLKQN